MNNTETSPKTGRLAPDSYVFHAWQEDYTHFDGNALYLDLETAKAHAAYDYEGDEYGHFDEETDDPKDRPVLTWTDHYGHWALIDGDKDTSVRIDKRPLYRLATPTEIVQQDAERAARKAADAAKYAGMTYTEAIEAAARDHAAAEGVR